jgi:hypothetical protein
MRTRLTLLAALAAWGISSPAFADGLPVPGSTYHILFATAAQYRTTTSTLIPPPAARFHGIAGADYQVSSAAFNSEIPGSGGWTGDIPTYRAILSISGDNARDRLSVSGPILNMHGTQLATSHADLFDGSLAAPVAYDEFGNLITSNFDVWTGCSSIGASAGQACGSWNNVSSATTGRIGSAQDTNSWLSKDIGKPCNASARLYALSNPLTAPLWGDYDGSGTVDGRDFLEWQRYVGVGGDTGIPIPTAFFAARTFLDGNANAPVGAADLEVWAEYYGQSLPVMTSSAPEPSTVTLMVLAIGLFNFRRWNLRPYPTP